MPDNVKMIWTYTKCNLNQWNLFQFYRMFKLTQNFQMHHINQTTIQVKTGIETIKYTIRNHYHTRSNGQSVSI